MQCSSSGEAIRGKATDGFLDGTLGTAGLDETIWTRSVANIDFSLDPRAASVQMGTWVWA